MKTELEKIREFVEYVDNEAWKKYGATHSPRYLLDEASFHIRYLLDRVEQAEDELEGKV